MSGERVIIFLVILFYIILAMGYISLIIISRSKKAKKKDCKQYTTENIYETYNNRVENNIHSICPSGNVHFVSFGVGSFLLSSHRIEEEAKRLNIFNTINIYRKLEDNWKKECSRHVDNLKTSKRGYGYWFWKPRCIRDIMKLSKENDIIVYVDSGCSLYTTEQWKELLSVFSPINTNEKDRIDIISFQLEHPEHIWTKGDIFYALNIGNDSPMYYSGQHIATVVIIRNSKSSRDFIDQWCSLTSDFHLISDEQSITSNSTDFKENRHDQSIFSCLLKRLKTDNMLNVYIIPDITYPRVENQAIYASRLT